MEGEGTSSSSKSTGLSQDLNSVNLEDTFITLQTKEGHKSQQIPLFQFLEQVVGGKVDGDVKTKTISLLMSGAESSFSNSTENKTVHTQKDDESESKLVQIQDSEEQNMVVDEDTNGDQDNKIPSINISGSESPIPQKPRGRGRPRKIKTEMEVKSDETAAGNDSVTTPAKQAIQKQIQKEDSTSVKKQPEAVQSLRRSSRIPTKNCRFKDDYVDSSLLTSKSATGDTRLMTLALAAECHTTTKPTKQAASSAKQHCSTVDHNDDSSSDNKVSQSVRTSRICESERGDAISDADIVDLNSPKDLKNEVTETRNSLKLPRLNSIFKRSLDTQLNTSVSRTKDLLSECPVELDNGNEIVFPFYIITEPKSKLAGNAFLIQKMANGIKYKVADITGNDGTDQPHVDTVRHPQTKYYACNSCDKIFKTVNQLQFHCKEVHSLKLVDSPCKSLTLEKEIHACKRCNQKFPFQFMLDKHSQRQCDTFKCQVCNENFSTREEFDEHLTSAHPLKNCATCDISFVDAVSLRRHTSNCHSKSSTLISETAEKNSDSGEKKICSVVIKSEDINLTDQDEEILKQWDDNDSGDRFYEIMEDEGVDAVGEKIECELCGLKFSTFSGVWHHKLDVHHELYPPGFKEKLEARLNKNQQMLSSITDLNSSSVKEEKDQNNYFVIMKPKWYCSINQLKISMENKKFNFLPMDSKMDNSSDETIVSSQTVSSTSTQKTGVLFHCEQCSLSYETASNYREHRSKVHNECFEAVRYLGAFPCTYCSDTFPCQFMLDEHVKQHTGKKVLPCTLCGLTFHKINERRQHWKQVHPGVGCPNCGKMYASIKYLQKHISLNCQDHYPATKKFIAFRKKQHNDFHMEEKDKRVEKKIIKCHLCPKICSSIHGWRRHMSENHEDEGFSKLSNTCIICNAVIYGYKALEKHLLEVHAEESGLPIEEENTIVVEALKKSKVDIQDYQQAGKSNTNIYQDEEGMFHCPECPKTHSELKALTVHIKTHINMQLECSICKKSFKNPTLLKQHVMRHRTTAVYDCKTCNKKFMTLQKLNKHNKVHHSKESFVCELCGMSFALNDYLLKHKRCHTDKRPHLCSVCGKTFRTKPELRVHVLIHTQETPYVCEHCGRGFTQKGNWRIHLTQHTGAKPHKCKHCELSFALPSHLKRHLLTHNQQINYRCIWCDKECTQRKHMQMHVTRVHKEDFFHYEEQMKLDNPIPIAPSQLKIYNRRFGKAGQVRKAYKTRAKKCTSSIQDILDGMPRFVTNNEEEMLQSEGVVVIKPLIEENEETVTSDDISIANQDISCPENLQILVSEDHQNYVKHGIPTGLIEEDGSNVEIIMGENNEINIIINNNAESSIATDLPLQDGMDDSGSVSLTQFTDSSCPLPSSLQQAVNALVVGQKSEDLEGEETELPLDMEVMIPGDGTENYTIVYPSES